MASHLREFTALSIDLCWHVRQEHVRWPTAPATLDLGEIQCPLLAIESNYTHVHIPLHRHT